MLNESLELCKVGQGSQGNAVGHDAKRHVNHHGKLQYFVKCLLDAVGNLSKEHKGQVF